MSNNTSRPRPMDVTQSYAPEYEIAGPDTVLRSFAEAKFAMAPRYTFALEMKGIDPGIDYLALLQEQGFLIHDADLVHADKKNRDPLPSLGIESMSTEPLPSSTEGPEGKAKLSKVSATHVSRDGVHARITWREYVVYINVIATTRAEVDTVTFELQDLFAPYLVQPPADKTKFTIWNLSTRGDANSKNNFVDAPSMDEARANYPLPVRDKLDELIESIKKQESRVHVWHGSPGTGKTSMIRILAKELNEEMDVHIIADPGQLLSGNVSYLLTMITEMQDQGKSNLIVLEDTGHLLTASAGHQYGDALGRILNVTDGVLAQNVKVSVLITTNEEVGRLHPALLRPGRCGSQIDFRKFTRDEAKMWLIEHGGKEESAVNDHYSLAELYELLSDNIKVVRETQEKAPFGFQAGE